MSEIWWLYLLTRLDNISCMLTLFLIIGGIAYAVFIFVWVCEGRPDEYKGLVPLWKMFAITTVFITLIPNKNDVAFILAGTGIIETAKSDTAQRLAGKSVSIFEKYLDELLKEEKK